MANVHQPLLSTPPTCQRKTLYLIITLIAITGSIALLSIHFSNKKILDTIPPLIDHICYNAHDKASCMSMVSELAGEHQIDATGLLKIFLKKSSLQLKNTINVSKDVQLRINDPKAQDALADCVELLDLSMDRIMDSVHALEKGTIDSRADAHAWLSSILTNHFTCLDGLKESSARSSLEPMLNDLVLRARTSLAMIVSVSSSGPNDQNLFKFLEGKFPTWVTRNDRKLLEALTKDVKANVVVAKDGTGKYKTVKEAVDAAPDNSNTRYVIYVKKGTYKENVEIGKKKKNIMLAGDGMDKTIITGSLNVVDGSTTFRSATVAAVGDGFMAQDIWFQNTAGPQKHQAVALRVGADQSVINRCRIDAYQDTLYTHSLRQFYRDSYITGTVDFIFGNAAVVFQNCKIVARKPMDNQGNMVTAQGREDPNQNTGTSIQTCEVIASSDLAPVKGKIKTFLGRPWKEYSRTVYMQSFIGDHIDPTGWSPWTGDFALKTLYYGEYMNKGPGAGTSKRVKWPGYHIITNPEEAKKFTVDKLIQGGSWLKSTGVAFIIGL